MGCGSTFVIKELGEGKYPNKPGFIKTRIKCLEQLRIGSPTLPLALESEWSRYSKAYAQECCRVFKDSTGTMFLKKVNMVIAELGAKRGERKAHAPNCGILEQVSKTV